MKKEIIENEIVTGIQLIKQTLHSFQKVAIVNNEIMQIEDIVALTGLELETVDKLIEKGIIPYYTPNGLQLKIFKKGEILNWLFTNNHNQTITNN